MDIDHEQLEDWLDNMGYVSSRTTDDLRDTIDTQQAEISSLRNKLDNAITAIGFILEERVAGYTKTKSGKFVVDIKPGKDYETLSH